MHPSKLEVFGYNCLTGNCNIVKYSGSDYIKWGIIDVGFYIDALRYNASKPQCHLVVYFVTTLKHYTQFLLLSYEKLKELKTLHPIPTS